MRFLILLTGLSLFAQQGAVHGTWSATDGKQKLVGTWTARRAAEADNASGTWELVGREGAILTYGTWSLTKDAKSWAGSWAARLRDNRVISGEWTAQTDLEESAAFEDLLKSAIARNVTGTWSSGKSSGSWAIRTR